MSAPNPIRRTASRRAMQVYLDACYTRGYYPTTDEVTDAGMDAAHASFTSLFLTVRRWMKYEAMSMLRSPDPGGPLTIRSDSLRAPNWTSRRAERRRDIERQVVEQMERDLGRPVTAEEAWPRVESLLRAEGLL